MKAVLVAFALAIICSARAEFYAPRTHPVIPSLVLLDGRTLTDARILSDTAYSVSVATGGKVIPVDKKLLPPELLAQWPVDEVRGAKDRAVEQAVIEKREAAAAKRRDLEEQSRQQHINVAMALAAKSKAANDEREALRVRSREALLKSRGGLTVRGVGSVFGKILVLVDNVSEGTVTFEWERLRFTTKAGDAGRKFADVIFDKGELEDYVVQPHTQRVFALRQIPVLELASVRWEDRPEVYPVRQLYRLRSAWDLRDHRMDFKGLPAKGEPLPDDDVSKILVAASRRYLDASLRE